MTEINEVAGPDAVIVDECWSSSAVLRQVVAPRHPRSYFRSRKGGSIGWGLPGALGIKLGLPDRKVLAVVGDGSAAWSMQSLWTAAHYRIPVAFVITSNSTYRQVKLVRKNVLGDYPLTEKHVGMEIDDPAVNFTLLAESMGVQAERVGAPEDLGRALATALGAPEPRLIEVLVENKP